MTRPCLALLALLAALLCGPSAGHSTEPGPPVFDRNWTADSTTAMGVTGDVRMTAESITFDGRVTFRWRYIGDITPVHEGLALGLGNFERFAVYELIDPQPRAIKGGSHLCGWPKYTPNVPLPRYIAISAYTGNLRDQLGMAISSGAAPPKDTLYVKGEFCGSYSYSAARRQP